MGQGPGVDYAAMDGAQKVALFCSLYIGASKFWVQEIELMCIDHMSVTS